MAKQPRFQYAGSAYHMMACGDGGKTICIGRENHKSFLYWLERVCGSHGWRVHAWVLMGLASWREQEGRSGRKAAWWGRDTGTQREPGRAHLGILGKVFGLPDDLNELRLLKKGDPRKVAGAAVVKERTSVIT